ncbi:MAG: CvpA family protein [Treponema sp.]|jgi:membrane protein required for colicin V production|nr:CvpA family protein [Treponema sp.]
MIMAIIDIVFFVLIVILIIRCGLRGLIREIMSMASVALGLFAAVSFYRQGAAFVRTKILSDVAVLPELIAFVSLLAIVFFAIKILEHILQDIIVRIHLGALDHALGLVVGLLEGLILARLILFVLDIQPLFSAESLLEHSIFARLLDPLTGGLQLPPAGTGSDV